MKFGIDKKLILGMAIGSVGTVVFLVALYFVILLVFYPSILKKNEENLAAPPVPGSRSADFKWALTSLDGEELDFSTLKGEVVFVTFWSPECPYCMIEMGYIQELHDVIAQEGVAFVCATSDKYRESAIEFAGDRGFTMPLYTYNDAAPAAYKHRITPAAFIIGRDEKIAWAHEGAARWNDETMIQYLRGLLIKKPE